MITSFRRYAVVGFSAVAVMVTGLVGCGDSANMATDAPTSKAADTGPAPGSSNRQIPKSIKNRPSPPPEAPAAPTP